MFRNYLKIAFRKIIRNKLYTAINIVGLTIGITCSCLLFLFVMDELSFDTMHEKADRIYRVIEVNENAEPKRYYGQTSPTVGLALEADFPQVLKHTRAHQPWGHIDINWEGQRISERSWLMVDSNFLDVFDFDFIHGSPENALRSPNEVVLTEDVAIKFFGEKNPVGEVLDFNTLEPITVVGVIKNNPDNSHFEFGVVLSLNTFFKWEEYIQSWEEYGAYTYVLLNEQNDVEELQSMIPEFITRHLADNPEKRNFQFQPLTDIYLGSENIEFGITSLKGSFYYIYIFLAIGIFILIIASINYINLATAKSMQRAKEIGLRKVSGAYRGQLIKQFLLESVLITGIAFVLSVGMVDLLLPYFNQIADKTFSFSDNGMFRVLFILFGISGLIGLLSGSFPAFYLSKLKPTQTLKGELKTTSGNLRFRQLLVITQFSLSIIMLIATLVVYQQMQFIGNKNLGFVKDQLLIVDINNGNVRRSFDAMKSEFSKVSGVSNVAVSSRVPGEWKNITQIFAREKGGKQQDSLETYFMGFDEDMLDCYQISLKSGANFTGNEATDSVYLLVNESAAKYFGGESALNTEIITSQAAYPFKIIGIIEDMHFQSLHEKIAPLIIGYRANPIQSIDYFSLKLDTKDLPTTLVEVTKIHEKFDDNTPMEYHFLDQQLEVFYQNESKAGKLFAIGAGLTIFIACMGLFGLASFIIQRRTKEIGLRKVLGASNFSLLVLLLKNFAIQVAVSFVIAAPVAYFIMNKWLEYFTYKTNLSLDIFLTAGALTLVIAILTVGYRALKATSTNPSETLKVD